MNREPIQVSIAGWSVHVPGFRIGDVLEEAPANWTLADESAAALLGKRGLSFKEPATKLALCAVHRALGFAAGTPRASGPPDPLTAVVASSNLGNAETVCRVVNNLTTGSLRDVSPLDAPNVSSNIIASTVAIWFGCGGPNLMVCSGATSGLDAFRLGARLLQAGRAGRVIVVGAEPDDARVQHLYGARLRAGAAAVLLTAVSTVLPGVPLVEGFECHTDAPACVKPGTAPVILQPSTEDPARTIDILRAIGDTYGALGVMQVALAAAAMEAMPQAGFRAYAASGSARDGWRSVRLRAARQGTTIAEGAGQ